jgi:hypothetical protein
MNSSKLFYNKNIPMSHKIETAFLSLFLVLLLACTHPVSSEENSMAVKPIKEVLKERAKALISIPGVVGAGEGLCEGEPCIKVFVIKKTPEIEKNLPSTLEGYPVRIEETGEIKALPGKPD